MFSPKSTISAGPSAGTPAAAAHKGQTLAFENLSFSTPKRTILSSMSAVLEPGNVVAIMGPSGAGKTSLLNILAGRVGPDRNKSITGRIMLDGKPIDPAVFRTQVAYVMQNDALLPFTTPREALRFSAYLRRPHAESRAVKEAKVEEMLDSLRLRECADTYVGNEFVKGLSGGEKKRTAIGVELVTDPEVRRAAKRRTRARAAGRGSASAGAGSSDWSTLSRVAWARGLSAPPPA
jgi:ABC-type multidrug transport system ATPase subunit